MCSKNFTKRAIVREHFPRFSKIITDFSQPYLMNFALLPWAIDHEEIRKANRNRRCYGALTVFAFLEVRNEPDKDLVRERQVL